MARRRKKSSQKVETQVSFNFKLAVIIVILVAAPIIGYLVYDIYTGEEEGGGPISISDTGEGAGGSSGHRPVVELFMSTTCPHCPTADRNLLSLYQQRKDFTFVVFVTDKVPGAYKRASQLGITGVPTAVYDGGVSRDVGAQSKDTYSERVDEMKARKVMDIAMSLDYRTTSSGYSITLSIDNSDYRSFNGRLMVYAIEKTSPYTAFDGSQIHYAFVDFVSDSSVSIDSHDTLNREFNYNSDIPSGNIMFVAILLDSSGAVQESYVK